MTGVEFAMKCDPFEPNSPTTTETCATWRKTVAQEFDKLQALHASDLALNQAALLREAADFARKHWGDSDWLANQILAIPTDQPALDRHDAELLAREAEARSRVLLANENLRAEIAQHKAETATVLKKAVAAVDNCLKHIDYSRERKQGDGTTVTPLTIDVAEVLAALRAAAGAPEETK